LNGTNAAIQDMSMSQNFYNVTASNSTSSLSTTASNVKFGTAALDCAGTTTWPAYFGQSYSSLDNVPIEFGLGDYTIEGWVRAPSGAATRGIFQIFNYQGTTTPPVLAGTVGGIALGRGTGTSFRWWVGATDYSTASGAFPNDTYIHFAIVRDGTGASNTKLYLGGALRTTTTDATNYTGYYLAIGGWFQGVVSTYAWIGQIDEFRISKYAVYTSAFTPYAYAFPDV
jgi:hypothetical protein